MPATSDEVPTWTFLTGHARALVCIAQSPDARLRDVAREIGATERAAQRIVSNLVGAGYVTRRRTGRRNTYTVHVEQFLRRSVLDNTTVGDMLRVLGCDVAGGANPSPGQAKARQS